jgi:hypothetical protein
VGGLWSLERRSGKTSNRYLLFALRLNFVFTIRGIVEGLWRGAGW